MDEHLTLWETITILSTILAIYNRGGIEIINDAESIFYTDEYKGYLKGTNLTYLLRSAWKGQNKHDILKAEWYAKRLSDEVK